MSTKNPFLDFNPRSREGSDIDIIIRIQCPKYFNPRSREGSDRDAFENSYEYVKFQSALPRGERPSRDLGVCLSSDFNPRSREGSDFITLTTFTIHFLFQSALPRGERRGPACQVLSDGIISIRAPARGATPCRYNNKQACFTFQSALPRGERLRVF